MNNISSLIEVASSEKEKATDMDFIRGCNNVIWHSPGENKLWFVTHNEIPISSDKQIKENSDN